MFNSDDEFEYFVRKERPAANPTYDGETETYGFQLMQSNGNCLIDYDFDQAISSGINIYTYEIGNGKLILEVEYGYYPETVIRYLYDTTQQGGAMQVIAKGKSAKAYPNPVKSGDTFRIESANGMAGSTVTVNAIDGSLVNAFECTENKAEIPTSGMSEGIYLYTVTRNGKILASGKMVIE